MDHNSHSPLRAPATDQIGGALEHYESQAVPLRRQVKITKIRAMQTKIGTLIKIETDAGITGY